MRVGDFIEKFAVGDRVQNPIFSNDGDWGRRVADVVRNDFLHYEKIRREDKEKLIDTFCVGGFQEFLL